MGTITVVFRITSATASNSSRTGDSAMRGPRKPCQTRVQKDVVGWLRPSHQGPLQIRIGVRTFAVSRPEHAPRRGPYMPRPHPAVGLIPQRRGRAGAVTAAIPSRTLAVALHDVEPSHEPIMPHLQNLC